MHQYLLFVEFLAFFLSFSLFSLFLILSYLYLSVFLFFNHAELDCLMFYIDKWVDVSLIECCYLMNFKTVLLCLITCDLQT